MKKRTEGLFSPADFFIVFAIIFQLIYITNHFVLRDYWHGAQRFFHSANLANTFLGHPDTLPVSFLSLLAVTAPNKLQDVSAIPCEQWQPNIRKYCSLRGQPPNFEISFESLLNIPLNRSKSFHFISHRDASHYSIIGYLPYVAAIMVGLLLNLSPVLILYFSVFINAAFAIALGYYTLRLLPVLRWPICFLLLMPSSFMIRSYVMPDAMTMELSFFILALVLHMRYSPAIISIRKMALMIILAGLMGGIKIVYFLVPFVYLLIPDSCFTSRRQKMFFVFCAVSCSILAATLWNIHITHNYYAGTSSWQLQLIYMWPLSYLKTIYSPLINTHLLMNMLIPNMLFWGVWQVWSHGVILFLFLPLLLLTFIETESLYRIKLPMGVRMVSAAIFFASWGLVLTAMHLHWVVPAQLMINLSHAVQGRYFVPILVYFLLAWNSSIAIPERWRGLTCFVLHSYIIISLIILNSGQLFQFFAADIY